MRITGLKKVQAALSMEIRKIENRSSRSLEISGLKIRADAQRLCPVDSGNLRSSAFNTKIKTGSFKQKFVAVGFNANYAVYVHEIDKDYTVGQWKFLQTAIKMNHKTVINNITRHSRV